MPLVNPIVPEAKDVGQYFMKGLALVSEINARKQEQALRAQQLVQKTLMDEKNYQLDREKLDETTRYHRDAVDIDQQRLNLTGEIGADVTADVKAATSEMADLQKNTEMGSAEYVQGLEDIKNRHPVAMESVHGQRIWKPTYDTATRILQKSKADFSVRNKALFGVDIADPWENPQNWEDMPDGRKKFPVWYTRDIVTKNPDGTQTVTATPVRGKDVIMSKSGYEGMLKQYQRVKPREGEVPLTNLPTSPEDEQKIVDLINASHPDWTPAQKRNEYRKMTGGQ